MNSKGGIFIENKALKLKQLIESEDNQIIKKIINNVLNLNIKEMQYDKNIQLSNISEYEFELVKVKANLRKVEANIEEQVASKRNEEKKEQKKETTIKVGSLVLDLEKYEVHIDGKVINLTLREFEVLKFLAQQPGQVVTRESLLERVWGYEYYGDIRTVDVTVRRIRERIEKDTSNPQILITKRGVGYYIPNK